MAPAVEIDPRLLRQLEEEYEALKNDTERESKLLRGMWGGERGGDGAGVAFVFFMPVALGVTNGVVAVFPTPHTSTTTRRCEA